MTTNYAYYYLDPNWNAHRATTEELIIICGNHDLTYSLPVRRLELIYVVLTAIPEIRAEIAAYSDCGTP
ncbi:hypothetical protein CJU90_2137 [Yarrowia sp. C11]|nr:hypothetical protein CKK34_6165 [Yarrowia sp. E02]KAG5372060.1 hypothetical protein CJU90_2137 [Yarrowia sp. C11]